MIRDDEILQEFVVESSEHLADVESQLLQIEECGADINVELVNTVFRAVHSVKGAAGFLGLGTINALAHNLENVLNAVRNMQLVPDGPTIDILLRSADTLRTLIVDVDSSNSVDVSEQIAALQAIMAEEAGNDSHPSDALAATESAPAEPKPEVSTGGSSTDEEEAVEIARSLSNVMAEMRATLHEAPAAAASVATPPAKPNDPSASVAEASDRKPAAKQPESNLRVSVSILDKLMNLAGELVLGRNQLLQLVGSYGTEQLDVIASRLDRVTSELQEAIVQTRMQPVGSVFNRFPRVVRDLSGKLGKQCELEIEGSDVEVDKTIIEAIGDPLTHLVRNSVDHGIEMPAVRRAAGKPQQGTIRLRAFHRAGKVCVRIEDDGAGIDPARIKAKAVEKGLLSEQDAANMSTHDALRLIFAPGFSTAAALTDVSGRGVGMDVVRTNIERIGGTVDIESDLGTGSAMHITLPLTLAIIPSMIISCRDEKYAIPQANIAELVRVAPSEEADRLGNLQGAEVLRLRGDLLPLIRLNRVLGIDGDQGSRSSTGRGTNIVVVESGQYRYGIAVDMLFDSEEIVVKPLGRQLKELSYLAGATILGDGRVALILDITGIAQRANIRSWAEAAEEADKHSSRLAERHRLLLFDNAPGEHFAIPMACVSRIEQAAVADILDVGGQSMLTYRGGMLPLLAIEDHLRARPRDASLSHISIIVFTVGQREIGVIAPRLHDISDVELSVDAGQLREPGVAGVIVIDEAPTRLLDIVELTKTAHPSWVAAEIGEVGSRTSAHVLLAEDSAFFRRHAMEIMVDEGYTVTPAVDGQDALQQLQKMATLPDVVVTDIEMPNMNGLEFCRAIRREDRTRQLPVIALTSLAGTDDIDKGKAAGIDEYQIKLDRANLIQALARYTAKSK